MAYRNKVKGPTEDKAKLGPPPRWLKCPRKGTVVQNKFIPMKTPLCSFYDEYVSERYRFKPKMVFDSLQSQYEKIGLWIDLTNTDRFYSEEEVKSEGAQYVKFNCRGHGETPTSEQTEALLEICRNFSKTNPKKLIAIHCTHGFNRTGFFICAYLVEELDWSIEAAVSKFADARPPGIYKHDYLQELFRRYGDEDDTPEAPQLPDWCDESEPILNDDEAESEASNKPCTSNEVSIFMDGQVATVQMEPDPSLRDKLQKRVQELCPQLPTPDKPNPRKWKRAEFPGGQPVSMLMENLVLLTQKFYKVSWKADGVRYMMLIEGEDQVYMFDRDHRVFKVPHLSFPHRKESRHVKDTLVDGEMIIDEVDGKKIFRYLIYDVIRFEGNDVGGCNFSTRLLCITKELIGPRNEAMSKGLIDKSKEPFSVRLKDFWDVSDAKKLLGEKFTQNVKHELDGLIFQPADDPYCPGRCMSQLKWKPPSMNSVDFKLQVERKKAEGMLPEFWANLYVLGLDRPFAVVKAAKEFRDNNHKIVECNFENGTWKFMRVRTDKSHPNALATAMGVCKSINEPITKEILLKFIERKALKKTPPAGNHVTLQTHKRGVDSEGNGQKPAKTMPPPNYVPPAKSQRVL